ncbi:MAG: flagellar biosynthesis protein FlgD [Novosphingobium sp.]|uniref:flagellar hook assembly protein FlgD n=1 Tax=Novosphingobium sp. TaxID=1874826 RepID=UPI001D988652|nr:flagellar hook capping FlgD N-terminal domain-containing protein [Novosphingobium sp.]MCB2058584.1 flagellar biosynthesis protein FlgD [Novosphingobium sp.]MCP5385625.1 flagellar biosynthesis protein FlgD [Novosphingobium sp.]
MTVSSVTSTSSASAGSSSQQLASKTLGQADFIRLMTTQMKLQDPLEPVDNKEMIAQMAQFSSLAGIGDINANLEAITARLDLMLAAQSAVQTPSTTA